MATAILLAMTTMSVQQQRMEGRSRVTTWLPVKTRTVLMTARVMRVTVGMVDNALVSTAL